MSFRAQLLRKSSQAASASIALQKTPSNARGGFSSFVQLQHTLGNRTVQRLVQRHGLEPLREIIGLQTKLSISKTGDQYEQEADHVANHVMAMPNPSSPTHIQLETVPEESEEVLAQPKFSMISTPAMGQRKSLQEEDVQQVQTALQQHKDSGMDESQQQWTDYPSSSETGNTIEKTIKQKEGSGSPLPDPVRNYMEPRFGVDFGDVRIHQGKDATKLNHALHAQAFTVGKNIYLGAEKTAGNSHLLAHELTHVVQQTGKSSTAGGGAQRTCSECGTKNPNKAPCLACATTTTSAQTSSSRQKAETRSVQRAPSTTSNNCWSLRMKCYYWCTKSHLWKLPPDSKGFGQCKRGCCDWAYHRCRADGTWPCIFPGM